jgi:hypothetical protein
MPHGPLESHAIPRPRSSQIDIAIENAAMVYGSAP